MQMFHYQTAGAGLYRTADAGLYQTADAGDTIRQKSRNLSITQTTDAVITLLDSGCRKNSIRQRTQKTLYQAADAGYTL